MITTWKPLTLVCLTVIAVLAGCATPAGRAPTSGQSAEPSGGAAAPKRISAVIMGDPPTLTGASNPRGTPGAVPGLDCIEELILAGLANFAYEGTLRPQLAEAVPTLENGLWKLEPDGRMELTWKIRRGAEWHDGVPITADDFLFTAAVSRDRELPTFFKTTYSLVDAVAAPDPTTITVRWKGPFINADGLFSRSGGTLPLPKHILERPYLDDKVGFLDLPYWNQQFVGTGPFRVKELVNGSHLLLEANDRYVLGRPKIDVIEIAMVPDGNTLITHLLSGSSEITLNARISLDQALQARDLWGTGQVVFDPTYWITAYPQFINPNPPIIANVQFRRALQYAADRQQMVEAIAGGLTAIAETTVSPNQREYADVESAIIRYPYEPRRAAQHIEELGYTKGSDGMFRDASNVQLMVQNTATAQLDYQTKALAVVSDYWRRAGVAVDEIIIPNQRVQDREYRNTRPGFETLGLGNDPDYFQHFHSSRVPLPQNGFVGTNRSRYANPELDVLVDRYFQTIPRPQRIDVLRQIVHHISDQLPFLGLFYATSHTLIGNRLKNVGGRGPSSTEAWNGEQWDVS